MAVNNNGNRVDDSGAVAVDFVWGNFPMQPNDDRGDSTSAIETVIQAADAAQDKSWSAVKKYQSGRLDLTKGIHAIVEADYAGFPGFTGNVDGAYIDGAAFISVPNLFKLATAAAVDALKDAGFAAGNITTAAAYTPAISNITLTSNVMTVTTAAAHGLENGDSVVIASLANGSGNASDDAALNGTYTIVSTPSGTTFTVAKTHANVTSHSVSAGTAKVPAKAGKIFTQSVAAGASSVALSATSTITPWA